MTNWRRRNLLLAFGSASSLGISGCISDTGSKESSDEEVKADPKDNGDEISENGPRYFNDDCSMDDEPGDKDDSRKPSIRVDATEPDADISLDIEVLQEFTADHPAKIQVTIRNRAEQEEYFEYGPSPLSHGEHDSLDAHIHAEFEANTYDEPEKGCWRSVDHLGGNPTTNRVSLDPGESVSESYELLAAAEDDYCLPNGLYRFESTVTIGEIGEPDRESVQLRWGVCLQ